VKDGAVNRGANSTYQLIYMLLKSTTRHIRLYAAEIQKNELVSSDNVLTLDVDPDNELNWDEDVLQKVYRKFDELVESYGGEDLTEYNLRRIGSDLEHFVRSLLQQGQLSYNLDSRVLNYSMGLPRVENPESEGKY
jgi:NAD(P)H-quinone oxidoreductase subunit M